MFQDYITGWEADLEDGVSSAYHYINTVILLAPEKDTQYARDKHRARAEAAWEFAYHHTQDDDERLALEEVRTKLGELRLVLEGMATTEYKAIRSFDWSDVFDFNDGYYLGKDGNSEAKVEGTEVREVARRLPKPPTLANQFAGSLVSRSRPDACTSKHSHSHVPQLMHPYAAPTLFGIDMDKVEALPVRSKSAPKQTVRSSLVDYYQGDSQTAQEVVNQT